MSLAWFMMLLGIPLAFLLVVGQADAQSASLVDYDTDDDRLIEVSTLEQLDAVRHDLNGDGVSDLSPGREAYSRAFPSPAPGFGCPSSGCNGYELTRDLDFNDPGSHASGSVNRGWSKGEGGEGWLPIGVHFVRYGAIFEGNSLTIANLFVDRGIGYVGLFGAMNDDGTIRNLGLVDVDVSSLGKHVAPLVGSNSGTIINCSAAGSVSGDSTVGGLVGANSDHTGTIIDSYASSTVTSKGSAGGLAGGNWYEIIGSHATGEVSGGGSVGGLVGYNSGSIHKSYATGNVTVGHDAGGLAGRNGRGAIIWSYATGDVVGDTSGGLVGVNYGPIRGSYATGEVTGRQGGGLVGYHSGSIVSGYATGAVSGRYHNGGLVGEMRAGSVTFGSYSTGKVTGERRLGGLAGWNDNPRGILSAYWNTESSGQEFGVEGRYISGAEGKTTAELQSPTSYTGIYLDWNTDIDNDDADNNEATGADDPWDFGTVNQYPALRADFDGDGVATWEEFGMQSRTAPPVTMDDSEPTEPPEVPPIEPSPLCMNGIVIEDPQDNPGLVADCTILLQGRDTLAGTATLNWTHDVPITQWHWISLDGSPPRIVELRLVSRSLTGRIPPEFGSLSALEVLSFRINRLTGGIPPELSRLSRLRSIDFHSNDLGGTIPPELGDLPKLEGLNLDGVGLRGAIPPELGNLSSLTHLNLGQNRLSGSIPKELSNLEHLFSLDLSKNNLTGPIPPELSKLESLGIFTAWSNGLTGSIPPELGEIPNLFWLNLGQNSLSGEITPELANLKRLNILSLRNNRLTGEIPDWFSGFPNLQELYLSGNELSGHIPMSLSNLPTLSRLHLRDNNLTGTIPEGLGTLSALTELSLSHNQLTGNIPPELGNLRRLTDLYLNQNDLTGIVPGELGNLTRLQTLLLDNNQLTGRIPVELSNLARLEKLYLQNNALTGSIPADLASITKLRELHVTDNQLSGCVPWLLARKLTLQLTHDMLPTCLPPVDEGSSVSVKASDLLGADDRIIVAVGDAINGTVSLDGAVITYTHNGSETIAGSFSYTVSDGAVTSTVTAAITVMPVNDPPVAVDDTVTMMNEGDSFSATAFTFLGNDTDAENDVLTIVAVGDPVNGSVSLDGTTIIYTHDGSETTVGGFSYTMTDGMVNDTATVDITVTPVNDPPAASDDMATVSEGDALTVSASTLLENDTDPENNTLSVLTVRDAVNGGVSLYGRTITYRHDGSETTTGSFTYIVSDGEEIDTATVHIRVTPVNDPPSATGDVAMMDEGDILSVEASALLENDADAENDTLKIVAVGEAVNGTVYLDGTTITYRHEGSETTVGSFSYIVSDGEEIDTAMVHIRVTPVNDPPSATGDVAMMDEGDILSVEASALLENDADAENDTLKIVAVGEAVNGTVYLDGTTVTYRHDGSETTVGSFSYTVSDGMAIGAATVYITVLPVEDADPVADEESTVTPEAETIKTPTPRPEPTPTPLSTAAPKATPTPGPVATSTTSSVTTPEVGAVAKPTPGIGTAPTTSPTTTAVESVPPAVNGGINVGLIVLIIVLAAAIASAGTVIVMRKLNKP